jgi:hypothetical protein
MNATAGLIKNIGLGVGAASPNRSAGGAGAGEGRPDSINWGFKVKGVEPGLGLRQTGLLGLRVVQRWWSRGGESRMGKLLDEYKIPMPSSYFNFN